MNKEMRQELKEKGLSVPRSNADAQILYDKTFKEPVVKLVSSNIYTYVGSGDEPPHMINFMGLQRFTRGKATEVNNLDVLMKIKGNPCFVAGEADPEIMSKSDEEARKEALEQIKQDKITNDAAKRKRA